jgi:hypothetical protein
VELRDVAGQPNGFGPAGIERGFESRNRIGPHGCRAGEHHHAPAQNCADGQSRARECEPLMIEARQERTSEALARGRLHGRGRRRGNFRLSGHHSFEQIRRRDALGNGLLGLDLRHRPELRTRPRAASVR